MAEAGCGIPEERWVDWHTGRLSPEAMQRLALHREHCAACREASRQWEALLAPAGAGGTAASAASAPPSARQRRQRRRLRAAVRRRGLLLPLRRYPALAAGGAAALLIALALLRYIAAGSAAQAEPPVEYAQRHEPEGAAVMQRPDTVVYSLDGNLSPGAEDGLSEGTHGTVWVNVRTHEIFVLLQGLLPSNSRDVQAWAVIRHDWANLGLLQFHERQGHLYARDSRIDEADELSFTIEPKGGSVQPTAPDSAKVRLAKLP
jgi:hypothetical protein